MTQRTELFLHMTQRIDFSSMAQRNWTFLLNATQRIEPFFNVIQRVFFTKMTLSILPFLKIWLQNWTLFWKTMTHRMEPFFSIWLKELNHFQNIAQRTETFSTYDSKNWTFFINRTFSIWLKRIKFFNMFWRVEPFFWYDLKNGLFWKSESNIWTLFEHDSKNWFFSYDSNNWALF